ncbi:hypothetical protein AMK10_08410 [Streptomyces sp. CB02058]|nr:hypothetical protein AMK10_08410 [Streptomyces sp. CB02058]
MVAGAADLPTRTQAQSSTSGPGSQGLRVSGATTQRGPPEPAPPVSGGTVTASPAPWQSTGGRAPRVAREPSEPVPHSSQASRDGSRWAVPGEANSSIRPRCVATGPEPGPSAQSCSSMRRPNRAGTFTMSNEEPHGSTPGEPGRVSHCESVLRGQGEAPASQAAPGAVTCAALSSTARLSARSLSRVKMSTPWRGAAPVRRVVSSFSQAVMASCLPSVTLLFPRVAESLTGRHVKEYLARRHMPEVYL